MNFSYTIFYSNFSNNVRLNIFSVLKATCISFVCLFISFVYFPIGLSVFSSLIMEVVSIIHIIHNNLWNLLSVIYCKYFFCCLYFFKTWLFRKVLHLLKSWEDSSHLTHTQCPLLLTSYINVVLLLQLMSQYWSII